MQKTTANNEQVRTMRDMVETVFRHKRKALTFFLTVGVTTLIVLAFTFSTYTSISKVIIHRGRESVFLDPTTPSGETFPVYKDWENEINSELEILKSRELVVQVIEKLGPSIFLEEPAATSGKLGWIRKAFTPARRFIKQKMKSLSPGTHSRQKSEQEQQIDKVIQIIEKRLLIEAQPKSDIITVMYSANSPELAQQVVTDLISTYLQKRIELQQDPGTLQFFTQQTELLLNELTENEARLIAIKEEAGIISLDDDRHALQATIETAKSEQLEVQTSLAAARARVNTIRTLLTPKSPEEQRKKSATLLDIGGYKELQTTLPQEEAAVSGWSAKEKEINQQLDRLQTELARINVLEPAIQRLQREHKLLEEKYRKYSQNKEQARINQELETRKFYNVSIVQHATMPIKSNPSGKFLKLIAALFLGMIGAVAIAFGSDYIDPTLHSAADITERLDLTTLAEIPLLKKDVHPPKTRKTPRGRHPSHPVHTNNNDYFQSLYFRLLASRSPDTTDPMVIGLTSSTGDTGVSTITRGLATALAFDGRYPNILLLDASPGNPSGPPEPPPAGLPFTYRSVHKHTSSPEAENSPASASALIKLLAEAKQEAFDIILIDIPSLDQGGYAVRLSTAPDLMGLVVDSGRTSWRSVQWAAELLNHADAKLCGIILNRQYSAMPKWLYQKL